MSRAQSIKVRIVTFVFVAMLSTSSFGQEGPTRTGSDVQQLARHIMLELELLAYEMGQPIRETELLPVADVSGFEVFFQAQTLFRKANTLAQEIAGAERLAPPVLPVDGTTAAYDYSVLQRAMEQIHLVKAELGIDEVVIEPELEENVGATGAFQAIVQANRQLNVLTRQQLVPADVFAEVTLAVIYVSGILELYPGAVTLPDEPAFENGMRPVDVYNRLIDCLRIIRRIADEVGGQVLRLDLRRGVEEATAADVYDLAKIVVADIGYLAGLLDAPEAFPDLPTPTHIFPSQVYQRVGILREQLLTLDELVGESGA